MIKPAIEGTRLPGNCPHCGGTFMVDKDGNKCMACSRVCSTHPEMKLYYDFNKEAIQADIHRLGRKKARIKWGIPWGSYTGLLTRWSRNGTPAPAPAGESMIIFSEEESPAGKTEPAPVSGFELTGDPEVILTITDHDLARLDGRDFDLVWDSLGAIVRGRGKAKKEGTSQ